MVLAVSAVVLIAIEGAKLALKVQESTGDQRLVGRTQSPG